MMLGRKCIGTIGYVNGMDFCHARFTRAWGELIQFSQEYCCEPGEYIEPLTSEHNFPANARNDLAASFRGDWLLQIDADHEPEPDLCKRLLHRMEQSKQNIATGLYFGRHAPHEPIAYHEIGTRTFLRINEWTRDAPFLAGAAGAGCLLVHRRVFNTIKKELGEEPFALIPPLLEDLSFFTRCSKLGIDVLCDPRIECPHLTVRAITSKDHHRPG